MSYKRLIVRWDKRQKDHVISYPRKCDGHLINNAMFSQRMEMDFDKPGLGYKFGPSLADELKSRGYDLTTLRFEISPLPDVTREKEGGV